jgi:hypothetical protein
MNMTTNSFIGALQSGGPASDRADKMTLLADRAMDDGCRRPLQRRQPAHGTWRNPFRLGARGTVRWSFTEITPDSFRWTGERSRDDGKTWHLQADFRARRKS